MRRHRNSNFTRFGTLGGATGMARAVTSRYVVGDSTTATGQTHGFISFAVPLHAGNGVAGTIHPPTDLNP